MVQDWREALGNELYKSYLPRMHPDAKCAICGATDRPMAFHAIDCHGRAEVSFPDGFVPMSRKTTADLCTLRGALPICTSCAAPCWMCGLPRQSDKLIGFYLETEKGFPGIISWGHGICEHFHLSEFLKRLFGDSLQKYVHDMKRERDAVQEKMNKVFDEMFGKR